MAETAKTQAKTTLPKEVFAVDVKNHELLKLAYDAYLSNSRLASATTKTRGEVRGGGKKPWKQKGTGRARFGSTRNPIWRGGGITFGPSGNENYTKKVNAKARKQSLKQALSLAVKDNRVVVIDDFVVKDGKTSTAAKLLAKINTPSRVTIVVDQISTELGRSLANLQEVNVLTFRSLSTYDVLNGNTLLFTSSAVKGIETRLGGAK